MAPSVSISLILIRRVNGGWVSPVETVRKPSFQRKTKRRSDNAIHDVGQARRELGRSAQGTHGRDCEAQRRGGQSRHDGRKRRAGPTRGYPPPPGFSKPTNPPPPPFPPRHGNTSR